MDLNKFFEKELNGKKITVEYEQNFRLTPYEIDLIRFWINRLQDENADLPFVLPVSKRFILDVCYWNDPEHYDIILKKFKKSNFRW